MLVNVVYRVYVYDTHRKIKSYTCLEKILRFIPREAFSNCFLGNRRFLGIGYFAGFHATRGNRRARLRRFCSDDYAQGSQYYNIEKKQGLFVLHLIVLG